MASSALNCPRKRGSSTAAPALCFKKSELLSDWD
jgi:hypothetical protein